MRIQLSKPRHLIALIQTVDKSLYSDVSTVSRKAIKCLGQKNMDNFPTGQSIMDFLRNKSPSMTCSFCSMNFESAFVM